VRSRLLGLALYVLVVLWRLTLRMREVGTERRAALDAAGTPVLHALWHQRMVVGIYVNGFKRVVTMASRSADGEVIAALLRYWGYRVVRGSTSRGGGEAMREMIREVRTGKPWAALTTDGPRGPARRSKLGIVALADAVGGAILPVGASSTRPKFLRSWDNFLLPLPFSRCVCTYGEPLRRAPGEPDEAFLARIDRALDVATDEADRLCGVTGAPRGREEGPKGEADDD
jgi:hypothetical protein